MQGTFVKCFINIYMLFTLTNEKISTSWNQSIYSVHLFDSYLQVRRVRLLKYVICYSKKDEQKLLTFIVTFTEWLITLPLMFNILHVKCFDLCRDCHMYSQASSRHFFELNLTLIYIKSYLRTWGVYDPMSTIFDFPRKERI